MSSSSKLGPASAKETAAHDIHGGDDTEAVLAQVHSSECAAKLMRHDGRAPQAEVANKQDDADDVDEEDDEEGQEDDERDKFMRVLRDPTQATFKTLDPSAKVRYRTWASSDKWRPFVEQTKHSHTKKFGDSLADDEGDKRSRAQRKRKQIPNTVRFSNDGGLPEDGQGRLGYRSLQMVEEGSRSSGDGSSKALPGGKQGRNDDNRGATPGGRNVRDGAKFGGFEFRLAGGSPQLSTKTVHKPPCWACATCTFENKGGATTCGVCGNDKPKPRMQIGLELRRDPQNGDLYSKAEFAKYVDEER